MVNSGFLRFSKEAAILTITEGIKGVQFDDSGFLEWELRGRNKWLHNTPALLNYCKAKFSIRTNIGCKLPDASVLVQESQ